MVRAARMPACTRAGLGDFREGGFLWSRCKGWIKERKEEKTSPVCARLGLKRHRLYCPFASSNLPASPALPTSLPEPGPAAGGFVRPPLTYMHFLTPPRWLCVIHRNIGGVGPFLPQRRSKPRSPLMHPRSRALGCSRFPGQDQSQLIPLPLLKERGSSLSIQATSTEAGLMP